MKTTNRSKAPAKATRKGTATKKATKKKPRLADRWDKERLEQMIIALQETEKQYQKEIATYEKEIQYLRETKESYDSEVKRILSNRAIENVRKQQIDCRHMLKSTTNHFDAVWNGTKKMETRKADRDFYIGDNILLQEYDPNTDRWSGREILVKVSSILTGTEYGIMPGYVILSIEVLEKGENHKLEKLIEENREHKLQQAIKEQNGSNYEKAPSPQAKDLRYQDTVHA